MEQEVVRVYYPLADKEFKKMRDKGYYIKQISGSGDTNYLWVLFEKNISNPNTI